MNPNFIPRRRLFGNSAANIRRHHPDYMLVLLAIFLLVCGLVVIYAISPSISVTRDISRGYFISKQFIASILGVGSFLIASRLPIDWWRRAEKPLLVAAATASVVVRIFGEEINGAQRWIQIGGISFQVAELIKLALLIWLAGFLANRLASGSLSSFRQTIKPLLIALGVVGAVVAVLQSDLGSAAVMVAMMVAMCFLVGLPLQKLALIALVMLTLGSLAIVASDYRRERVMTFLNPERDCQNQGYQLCESLKAIGSGGMFGRGLGKSVQAYGYLPEAANDSIFAIFAENFGFVGVTVLLGAFATLFTRIKRIMERTADTYSRLLLTGILAWFSSQVIINIGAMIGLLPLKGITLPFISTGGTSLLFVAAALGIVYQVSRTTSYGVVVDEQLPRTGGQKTNVLRRTS